MSLSDEIYMEFVPVYKVKQFIKDLKKKLRDEVKNDHPREGEMETYIDIINGLAGDKLIEDKDILKGDEELECEGCYRKTSILNPCEFCGFRNLGFPRTKPKEALKGDEERNK